MLSLQLIAAARFAPPWRARLARILVLARLDKVSRAPLSDSSAQSEDARVRWVDSEPGVCAIGYAHNLTIIVWWSQATGAAVERVAAVTRAVCAEHASFSNIHIIKAGAPLPTVEARNGFVQMMKVHADQLRNVAVVVGGEGFWASMMRSAVTSMRFVSPRSFELRLHGKADEILNWLPSAHWQRTRVELARFALAEILDEADRCMADGAVELSTVFSTQSMRPIRQPSSLRAPADSRNSWRSR